MKREKISIKKEINRKEAESTNSDLKNGISGPDLHSLQGLRLQNRVMHTKNEKMGRVGVSLYSPMEESESSYPPINVDGGKLMCDLSDTTGQYTKSGVSSDTSTNQLTGERTLTGQCTGNCNNLPVKGDFSGFCPNLIGPLKWVTGEFLQSPVAKIQRKTLPKSSECLFSTIFEP